jgi:hypothetical protein
VCLCDQAQRVADDLTFSPVPLVRALLTLLRIFDSLFSAHGLARSPGHTHLSKAVYNLTDHRGAPKSLASSQLLAANAIAPSLSGTKQSSVQEYAANRLRQRRL